MDSGDLTAREIKASGANNGNLRRLINVICKAEEDDTPRRVFEGTFTEGAAKPYLGFQHLELTLLDKVHTVSHVALQREIQKKHWTYEPGSEGRRAATKVQNIVMSS